MHCEQARGIADINYIWCRWLHPMGIPGTYASALRNQEGVLRLRDMMALRDYKRPARNQQRASLVIPTYGRDDLVLKCVSSMLQNGEGRGVEVVVAEDAAHVDCGWLLAYFLPGARLLRNDRNLGFLRNCNAAVSTCKAPVVLLANNDMVFRPGRLTH
ncbi:MAG: glycosyltransferase [Pseudomonadales bacterium]